MKRYIVYLLIGIAVFGLQCSGSKPDITPQVKTLLDKQFTELLEITKNKLLAASKNGNEKAIRTAFVRARLSYKKLEWFTEYYAPGTTRLINGPPLPEIEIEETKVFEPGGLQVIEEHIYPFEEANRKELVREVNVLIVKINHVKSIMNEISFSEAHITDACKLEVFRLISLGLSGFDTPLSKTALPETKAALTSIDEVFELLGSHLEISTVIKNAVSALDQNNNFNNFNRMDFILRFANPLTKKIEAWKKSQKYEPIKTELALYNKSETLFDKNVFNPDFFADNVESYISPEKVALGKQLFADPILSGSTRTCIGCHKPELAFTDGLAKSNAIIPGTFVKRNAPTLYYAGLQQAQFYDMRSPSLENQAMDVLANKDEMHASAEDAAARMNKLQDYVSKFKTAFPAMEKEIKPRFVTIVLASYIRSLNPFNSKFDNYVRGDASKMNKEEVTGFNLFMGKGKCGTCHFMPLFNGTAPPFFTNTEAEVLGVPSKAGTKTLDADLGRYAHNKIDELKFSFKTPTLRNIALTAPYMHNGAFKTLEEVMEFYNDGGGKGLGIILSNQTLSPEPLRLSSAEQKAIIAFMNSLTDKYPDTGTTKQ